MSNLVKTSKTIAAKLLGRAGSRNQAATVAGIQSCYCSWVQTSSEHHCPICVWVTSLEEKKKMSEMVLHRSWARSCCHLRVCWSSCRNTGGGWLWCRERERERERREEKRREGKKVLISIDFFSSPFFPFFLFFFLPFLVSFLSWLLPSLFTIFGNSFLFFFKKINKY